MKTYYCDGSSHRDLGKMGIGIIGEDVKAYYETETFMYSQMTHEIEAIIKTINVTKSVASRIRVVNDDKNLVNAIQKNLLGIKVKSKGLVSKPRFHYLLDLIKKYDIEIKHPKTKEEKHFIKLCHDLSRSYMR